MQVEQIGRVQRVRLVVGEGAVQLEVERVDLQRQRVQGGVPQNGRDGVAGHPVAGVHHDAQRADVVQLDQRAKVAGVVGQQVDALRHAAVGGIDAVVDITLCAVPDLDQP